MRAKKDLRCELITWERVYRMCRHLAASIREAGYRPDLIVAIARGGYVPARVLCDFLEIGNLTGFRIEHYKAGADKQAETRITSGLGLDITGMRVLLVDDVSDTGDTLAKAVPYLLAEGAAEVKSALLLHKEGSSVIPDFYAERIIEWHWIIYPWAVIEDIGAFLQRLEQPPATVAEAEARLEKEYGVTVPNRILKDIFSLHR